MLESIVVLGGLVYVKPYCHVSFMNRDRSLVYYNIERTRVLLSPFSFVIRSIHPEAVLSFFSELALQSSFFIALSETAVSNCFQTLSTLSLHLTDSHGVVIGVLEVVNGADGVFEYIGLFNIIEAFNHVLIVLDALWRLIGGPIEQLEP